VPEFDVSVVLCTWNRADVLPQALDGLAAQEARGTRYELLLVDNNSTDATRQVIESFIGRCPVPARYLFEAKQGLSHARNAGIASARGALVAFTDDDVFVSPDWVFSLKRAFDDFPQAAFIGGKVLPVWRGSMPKWMDPSHAGLAVQDYGNEVRVLSDPANRVCLIGANLACRRELFDQIGLFAPELQRVKDSVGSMEDDEFEGRAISAGKLGVYDPRIVIKVSVPEDRMSKRYHRKWHFGHGYFLALQKDPSIEQSSLRLLGVPGHMYRSAVSHGISAILKRIKGDRRKAFIHETAIWMFLGYFWRRIRWR
jgi:glycosyltransferase involved in cell wall biosynthesis